MKVIEVNITIKHVIKLNNLIIKILLKLIFSLLVYTVCKILRIEVIYGMG